jgi:predicted NUDIX family NTP pyrophosphohydrolase
MKPSAGILVFKPNKDNDGYLVLLAHPGGPLWGHKHKWTLPKGVLDENEDHLVAAYREFEEEIGMLPPSGKLIDLGSIKDGAKTNFIWAIEGDIDLENFSCNTFTMEWPLHSGIMGEFPENPHFPRGLCHAGSPREGVWGNRRFLPYAAILMV